jgi:hypothetical protein
MGLFAGERILKGQFIMQYIGEIFQINSALGRRRVQEYSVCILLILEINLYLFNEIE